MPSGRRCTYAIAIATLVVAVLLSVPHPGASATAPARPAASQRSSEVGGTAYFAEQPETPPNYIFPLVPGAYFTTANVNDFQTLLYEPLYWYGTDGDPSLDERSSLAYPPKYSDGDRVVTIEMKHDRWSDGEPVDARDDVFWINLLRADTSNWAAYVPGGFPDNVTSVDTPNSSTVVLHLDASYNPTWYTDNELSQITPLPLAWDRTSSRGSGTRPGARLPDVTTRGARAVYAYLSSQASHLATYATSPVWSVVDGPWRLASFSADGEAVFVPNRAYSGPDRPHLDRFVELPFTSAAAEYDALDAGDATGGGGATGGISVGYLPANDLPQRGALRARGYQLVPDYPFQFDYFEPNFDNPKVGPILRQLYVRQAFQHLVDETGWIRAFYGGIATPTYGPIPETPANPWADANEASDPYPFSVATARRLLESHGWRVRPGAVTTCVRPGPRADDCGVGIARGAGLAFNLLYPTGLPYTEGSMVDFKSVASEVGISITLQSAPSTVVTSTILSCTSRQPACSWQLGQYGVGWVYTPDHLPTGEEIFQTGALGNVSNFSSPAIDKLIEETTTAPADEERSALDRYQDAVRLALPDFWQPSPGMLVTLQSRLRGYTNNAFEYITPQDWWFARGR